MCVSLYFNSCLNYLLMVKDMNWGQLKSRLHSSLITDWLYRYLNCSLPSTPCASPNLKSSNTVAA